MPDSSPRASLWLWAMCKADELGPDFVEWAAKHCLQIANRYSALSSTLADISDWVRASYVASVPPHVRRALLGRYSRVNGQEQGEEFVTRPFSPDMSLQTVTKLSAEWHEAVANNMSGPNHAFPQPWCNAGRVNGFEIVPITTAGDLYLEGRTMHHCAGTYVGQASANTCCFFSIREGSERLATLQLVRATGNGVCIGQLRGPCNAQVSKPIERAVRTWLRKEKPSLPPLPQRKDDPFERMLRYADENRDDDIPF